MRFKVISALSVLLLPLAIFADALPTPQQMQGLKQQVLQRAQHYQPDARRAKQRMKQAVRQHQQRARTMAHIGERQAQHKRNQVMQLLNARQGRQGQQAQQPYHGVMLFVSLGMPTASLRRLVHQADRYQIPVLIRGFYKNNYEATAERIATIIRPKGGKLKNAKGGFLIDPNWFRQYDIERVPALVVTNQTQACLPRQKHCESQPYDIVRGNISLTDALNIIAENGRFAAKAKQILQDHKERSHD